MPKIRTEIRCVKAILPEDLPAELLRLTCQMERIDTERRADAARIDALEKENARLRRILPSFAFPETDSLARSPHRAILETAD